MGARERIKAQKPTVIHGMSAARYHSDPCPVPSLTASIAHVLTSKSPLHAWSQHPRLGARPRSPQAGMDYGTIAHALLFDMMHELVVVDADDWRTKSARDQREAARVTGRLAVLQHEVAEVREAVNALRRRLEGLGIVLKGKSEVSIFWQETADSGEQIQCRARLDHLIIEPLRARIIDLKTCRSAHPRACESHAAEYGYDIQAAAYRSAIQHVYPSLAGREEFHFLFAELEAPFALTPAELDGSFRVLGERRWRRAVNTWASCMRSNTWPDYGPCRLSAPHWALLREEEIAANDDYGSSEEVRRQTGDS